MIIEKYKISSEKIPPEFRGFKILHISDIHNKYYGEGQIKIINKVKELSPDIIVLTGDIVVNNRSLNSMQLLKNLPLFAPVYYVYGNHEYAVKNLCNVEDLFSKWGICLLNNTYTAIKKENDSIIIAGIKDPVFGYSCGLNKIQAINNFICEVQNKMTANNINKNEFTVLLTHRPECFNIYDSFGFDLILSGHAHGGQFRFPFKKGFFAPGQGFFPKLAGGYYKGEKAQMIVNRGAGSGKPIPRICNPYEMVFIELNK